jgi:hypothetical protein|tara:strand:+ start:1794 stop:2558 length:765 start_codon:yes stop_codon:yes gene_type:complete
MLLMAEAGEFDEYGKIDAAIFADTGWEPPSVYEHLEWLKTVVSVPIHVVSQDYKIRERTLASLGGKTRFTALPVYIKNYDGEKAMLRRQCTREYKIEPLERQARALLGLKKGQRMPRGTMVQNWLGISSDEAARMKRAYRPWMDNFYPLIERWISRQGCKDWMADHSYPEPSKSACIGCPFHDDGTWRDMKMNRPVEFADAVDFDHRIRTGLKGVDCEAFLHRSLQPLDEVDFRNAEDLGQLNFLGECEGYCGV